MLVHRGSIKNLLAVIERNSNKTFDIQTQYKLIKLKRSLVPELEILNEQLQSLSQFFETDDEGNFIYSEDGGVKIKAENFEQFDQTLASINNMEITLPDVYFSLEELAPLELTLNEVELFDFCIK